MSALNRLCLAVARKHGATTNEIDEVITLAMTIGAHKARLMAEQCISDNAEPEEQQPSEGSKPFT